MMGGGRVEGGIEMYFSETTDYKACNPGWRDYLEFVFWFIGHRFPLKIKLGVLSL